MNNKQFGDEITKALDKTIEKVEMKEVITATFTEDEILTIDMYLSELSERMWNSYMETDNKIFQEKYHYLNKTENKWKKNNLKLKENMTP